ncbi:MAG: hypothetical protein P1U34_06950 [Coxiellaceae bacterium]|nr:hypothetical protein [Coxiellaceae bacterium]
MSRDNIEAIQAAYPATVKKLKALGMLEPTVAALNEMYKAAENPSLPARIQASLRSEPFRAMHRMKSLIELYEGDYASFSSSNPYPIEKESFDRAHDDIACRSIGALKALAFLTLADGLKLNPAVATNLTDEQRDSLPKDSVMWLAYVLTNNPLAFSALTPLIMHGDTPDHEALSIIRDGFSKFLHYRWAYLAENVAELTVDCLPTNPNLLAHFWLLNACGFTISCEPGMHGDTIGASVDQPTWDFYIQFTTALTVAESADDVVKSLTSLYRDKASTLTGNAFNPASSTCSRLLCMMHGFNIFSAEALSTVTQEQVTELESLLPDSPQIATTKITFLPKLILAIKKQHPDITPFELLKVTSVFLQHTYASVPGVKIIPLCTLADDKELARQLRYITKLHRSSCDKLFEIQTPGGFANAMPTETCRIALNAAEQEAKEKAVASVTKLATAMQALSLCFLDARHRDGDSESLNPSCEATKPNCS